MRHVLLPLIIAQRDRIQSEQNYATRVRVGAGGGIAAPEAVHAAFALGAAFVVTGTINQMTRQAGTCDAVRLALSKATYSDVAMAPAADMFDQRSPCRGSPARDGAKLLIFTGEMP